MSEKDPGVMPSDTFLYPSIWVFLVAVGVLEIYSAVKKNILWTIGFLTYVVGDLSTTYIGLVERGMVEENPLMEVVWGEFGMFGLVMSKVLAVAIILCLHIIAVRYGDRSVLGIKIETGDRFKRLLTPGLMAIFGTAVCANNILVLVT